MSPSLSELRLALATGQLTLAYEPIVCLRTGEVAGWEALVRWAKDGAVLPPSEFLGLLVGSDLELPWIRSQLALIRQRMAARPGFIGFNLSGYALEHPELPGLIREEIWEPHRLLIEVSEELLISGDSPVLYTLGELRQSAHPLAIDDFGTGYSSFLRLLGRCRGLFSVLKLDRQLVQGCSNDLVQQALARAILQVARDLGIKVVAEGIESARDGAWLRSHGCDYGQGYLFSRSATII